MEEANRFGRHKTRPSRLAREKEREREIKRKNIDCIYIGVGSFWPNMKLSNKWKFSEQVPRLDPDMEGLEQPIERKN